MAGLIVAPTAIINGTPLDCTICKDTSCKFAKGRNFTIKDDDPGFNAWWVKKYCTMTAVDGFILYFPYILLVMALVMVLIERGFVRAFNTGLKLDTFYNLLVKEEPNKEGEVKKDVDENIDTEDTRGAIEVSHSFMSSSNYFLSYIVRTISEFVVAAALLIWLIVKGLPSIQRDEFILCDVYEYFYECAGHPQQFYMYTLFVAIVILIMFLLSNIYSLLWLAIPQLSTLGSVMSKYKTKLKANQGDDDDEHLGGLYKIYYNNRDLRLLLDLLASSSGIAPSLRILALFDRNLRCKIEPGNVHINQLGEQHHRISDGNVVSPEGVTEVQVKKKVYDVEVEFEDAEAIKDIFSTIKKITYLYTVEIQPPTDISSVTAIEVNSSKKAVRKTPAGDATDACEVTFAGTEMETMENGLCLKRRMKVPLYHLEPKKEYKIRVCTIVNGRTIARRVERIKPKEEVMENS